MTTPNLELPEWVQNQSQPHVTVNTALRVLDCLTQLRVIDRDSTEPDASPEPSEGDCYIVAEGSPAGDWEGHADDVAMYIGGAWVFRTPLDGWEAWVIDEQVKVRYSANASPPGWEVIA